MALQLMVPKLACSSCVKTVTGAVITVDSKATIQADTKTKLVNIETQASKAAIKEAIALAG
ncbi:heavy-metal-associated domain-containing protein [Chroococcidiopsis sp. CCMEE 29]|uniref:heavy-metal-associated domain-containing protein n=1 Tax=Chroococcidiopsis sp. CCMEE 29 TaxID=155894 RepID=UPI002021E6F1|nr:heavy-metal-associated domain-containing protein [Chroococcidiopsis sp. CCMEE 29]